MKRSPQKIAWETGVEFDETAATFKFESLGQKIIVKLP